MKKLIPILIIIMYLMVGSILILTSSLVVSAKLSDETLEIIEDLRMKHYGIGSLIRVADSYIMTWEPPPPIELIDIEIKGMKFKGWEIWINDKCYYVLLIEKEEDKNETENQD